MDRQRGGGGREREYGGGGKREFIYLSLHCHHQNDSYIKVGSDQSHFYVSFTVKDKVTNQCPQTTTFEEKGEPRRNRTEVLLCSLTNALPLGQTGSPQRSGESKDLDGTGYT